MVNKKTWSFGVEDLERREMDSPERDNDSDREEQIFDTPTKATNGNGRGGLGHGHESDDDHVPNQVEGKGRGRPKKMTAVTGKKSGKGKGRPKKGVKASPEKKAAAPAKSKSKGMAKKKSTGAVPERKSTRPTIAVLKEEEPDWEVSKILKVRTTRNGEREFYVSWKGYSLGESTWEPESNLNCEDLMKEFLAQEKIAKTKAGGSGTRKRHGSAGSSSGGKNKKAKADDDDDEYEVIKIMSVRFKNNRKEFKVQWKNYSEKEATWEPEDNLNCTELLKEFAAKVSDIKTKPGGSGSKSRGGSGSASSKAPKSKSPAKSMSDQSEDDGEDEEYEVSKILDMRTLRGGLREFQVQWKGYTLAESSWEPEGNLECKDLLKDFLAAKKNTTKTTKTGGSGVMKVSKRMASASRGPKKAKKIKIKMTKPKKTTAAPPPEKDEDEGEDEEKNKDQDEEPVGEEDNFEVEKILEYRYNKGMIEYNIKWKGWGEEDASWETEDRLEGCQDLLQAYKDKYNVKEVEDFEDDDES